MATVITTPAAAARRRSPLVLWHLLSLDAPVVAALWTALFLHIHHLAVTPAIPLALGLAVWMLYAADRLADAASAAHQMEERHRFHAAHRPAFTGSLFGALPLLAMLLYLLPPAVRDGWMLLALPLVAYVTAVHVLRVPRFPKEAAVGVFFAAAAMLPAAVASGAPLGVEAAGAACFGCVCWLNCVAIARWEQPDGLAPSTRGAANHMPHVCVVLLAGCAALARFGSGWTAAACAMSIVLLLALDRLRQGTSRVHMRALADAALLTPLLLLPLIDWVR